MMLSDLLLEDPGPAAPLQLTRALATAKNTYTDTGEVYEEFLEYADRARQQCIDTGIQILGKYKLTDALPANLNPDEASDTLIQIFQFYAKIKTSSSHTSFSAAEKESKFMSFSKLEIFLRDFKILPRLLTREEIKTLWGDIARAHVLAGRGVFTVIDLDQFKDLIIRMAMWAYHKPGLKKLIITLEGFMPRNVQILESFCHYLRLHDIQFISNFLRTKGRQTQGELNYRSKGETNLRTRMEVRADTDARKLSQVQSKPSLKQTSVNAALRGKKVNIFGEVENEERPLRGAHPSRVVRLSGSSSSPLLQSTLQSLNNNNATNSNSHSRLPASLLEKFNTLAQNGLSPYVRNVDHNGEDEDEDLNETPRSGLSHHSKPPGTKDFQFPDQKKDTHGAGANGNSEKKTGNAEDDSEDEDDEVFGPGHHHQKSHTGGHKTQGGYHFTSPDEQNDYDDDDDNASAASSVLSVFHDNSLEALKAAYENDYDPRLAKQVLLHYCYVPPVANTTDFLPTQGPVVDLGLLQGGAKVKIALRVSNGCGDDIFVDATARLLQAPDTHVSTYSKMLIPGLARTIEVTFTVPETRACCQVLGFVDVLVLSQRHTIAAATMGRTGGYFRGTSSSSAGGTGTAGGTSVLCCPIFYRVDRSAHRDTLPVCTAGALQHLLAHSSKRSHLNTATNGNGNTFGSGRFTSEYNYNHTMGTTNSNTRASTANTGISRPSTSGSHGGGANGGRKVLNVLESVRLGGGVGPQRQDWDISFASAKRQQPPLISTTNNSSFSTRPESPAMSPKAGGAGGAMERWPSGRFTSLNDPATRGLRSPLAGGSSPLMSRTASGVLNVFNHTNSRPNSSSNSNINNTSNYQTDFGNGNKLEVERLGSSGRGNGKNRLTTTFSS